MRRAHISWSFLSAPERYSFMRKAVCSEEDFGTFQTDIVT